jgi:hypothetical protein
MLPKFMPDLFQPIHLPKINWQNMTWLGWKRFRITSGYRDCRWMHQLGTPANDN